MFLSDWLTAMNEEKIYGEFWCTYKTNTFVIIFVHAEKVFKSWIILDEIKLATVPFLFNCFTITAIIIANVYHHGAFSTLPKVCISNKNVQAYMHKLNAQWPLLMPQFVI